MNDDTAGVGPVQRDVRRLRAKLAKRDARIAGLERRISALEHALAVKDTELQRLPRQVVHAVQEALCNVRMIPVLGVRSNDRIIEVREAPKGA